MEAYSSLESLEQHRLRLRDERPHAARGRSACPAGPAERRGTIGMTASAIVPKDLRGTIGMTASAFVPKDLRGTIGMTASAIGSALVSRNHFCSQLQRYRRDGGPRQGLGKPAVTTRTL